jgi:hypothetical protein
LSLVRELLLKVDCFKRYSNSPTYLLQFDRFLCDDDMKRLLLKELLVCDNPNQRLDKLRDNLFLRFVLSKVLNVNNAYSLMIQSKTADELSEIFKAVLLCCRLLGLESQKKFFKNIGELYIRAEEIAKMHGHLLPSLDVFLLEFFSFDIFPYKCVGSVNAGRESGYFWTKFVTIFSSYFNGYRSIASKRLFSFKNFRSDLEDLPRRVYVLGRLDCAIVSFASSLFFLDTGDEQICSLTIFTQLAK